MEVLLRILPLLVLSVFINLDSEACELTGDLKASMIFIRHNRSFSDAAKIINFSFNNGSGWVCARAYWINDIAYSKREASFFVRCVFVFSSIYIFFSICLTGSVRAINLSNYFNGNVCFLFLIISSIASLIIWLINRWKVNFLIDTETAILSSD